MPAPKSFEQMFADLRTEILKLRQRSPFYLTGMHPNGNGGIDSDNFVAGTSGYSFKADGDAEFNDLTLRGGIIGNDALTNPVVPAQAFQGASSFTLSVAGGNIVTITRSAPAGFTSAVVNAYGRVAAINSTASLDALYCAVDVNGSGGNQFGMPVSAGSFGSLSAGYSTLLSGLSAGDPVAVHLFASTGAAGWASNVANGADLSVTILWFR